MTATMIAQQVTAARQAARSDAAGELLALLSKARQTPADIKRIDELTRAVGLTDERLGEVLGWIEERAQQSALAAQLDELREQFNAALASKRRAEADRAAALAEVESLHAPLIAAAAAAANRATAAYQASTRAAERARILNDHIAAALSGVDVSVIRTRHQAAKRRENELNMLHSQREALGPRIARAKSTLSTLESELAKHTGGTGPADLTARRHLDSAVRVAAGELNKLRQAAQRLDKLIATASTAG